MFLQFTDGRYYYSLIETIITDNVPIIHVKIQFHFYFSVALTLKNPLWFKGQESYGELKQKLFSEWF